MEKAQKIVTCSRCGKEECITIEVMDDIISVHQEYTEKKAKVCPGCGGTNTREKTLAYQNDLDNTEDYCNDCEMFFFIIRQKLNDMQFFDPDKSQNQSSTTLEE